MQNGFGLTIKNQRNYCPCFQIGRETPTRKRGFFFKQNDMANEKKSFLLYVDLIHTIEKLTDEQTGKLFKHVLRYVNDLNPEPEDQFTEVIFEPIKQSLKRDLVKYESIRERNKANALKRWNATECDRIRPNTKNAVNDSDSVNVIVNTNNTHTKADKSALSDRENNFLNWFNQMKLKCTGEIGQFRTMSKQSRANYKELVKSGYTADQWQKAFEQMSKNDWVITNQKLTIDHFVRIDNFEKYLNQSETKKIYDPLVANVMAQIEKTKRND